MKWSLNRASCRNHGSHFEKHKTAIEEGGGRDEIAVEEEPREQEDTSRPDSIRIEDEKRASSDAA
jgi:MFS transporter, SHS family, lactate transporter